MDNKTLGKIICDLRNQRHLSQESLAELCGLTSKHLSDIERDKKTPKLDSFIAICRALRVPATAILPEDLIAQPNTTSEKIINMIAELSPDDQELCLNTMTELVRNLKLR